MRGETVGEAQMLGKRMLESLIAYDEWAMNRLLDQAAFLTEEELDAPTKHGRGCIRQILFHTVSALEVWTHVLAHGSRPEKLRDPNECLTVAALRAYADETRAACRAALAGQTEEQLAEEMTISDRRGNPVSLRRWHMVMQPLTHAMQHRAEVAAELTRLGRSPGDIDFLFFARS